MAKVKGCYAQPYAYGFTENGRIYIRLEGKIFDDLAFDSNIGVQLVNFAFLDEEIFGRCLFELFSYYAVAKAQKRSTEFIYELLTGYIAGLLPKSPYYYLFLLSYVEFLLDGEIDPRVITGVTPDDRALLKMAAAEVKDGVPDTTKSRMMDIFIRCFDFKRTLTEETLKAIYEENGGDGRTPLDRYYQFEQEDAGFRKYWGSKLTVELGQRNKADKRIVQHTILNTMDDLLRYEMLQFLTQGKGYKFCKNCGKPFIPKGRSDAVYCDRIAQGAQKTCKQIGPYLTEKEKTASVPAWKIYRSAYQRLNKRVELGYMEEEAFAAWNREATAKRDICLKGELGYKDFAEWIDSTSRQR